jgi:polyhydroxyalkanoate synthesis regulator phasin
MIKRVVLTTLLFAFAGNVMSAQAQFRQVPTNVVQRGEIRNNFQDYLNDLQRKTDRLKKSLDRDLDRSRDLNGSRREDNINNRVSDFKNEVDRLRDRFKDRKPIQDNIRSVLDYRSRIDALVQGRFVSNDSREYWRDLRRDLDRLERLSTGRYNQNNNGGFYRNDGSYNDNYRW